MSLIFYDIFLLQSWKELYPSNGLSHLYSELLNGIIVPYDTATEVPITNSTSKYAGMLEKMEIMSEVCQE